MSCEEALALAPARPFGALEPEELAALEAHLLGCEPCRVRAGAFERGLEPLRATEDEPLPEEAWGGIAARLGAKAPALGDEDPKALALPAGAPATATLPIALACTFCRDTLARGEATYCAGCLAPHHAECFAAHGRCSAPGCGETHVVRPTAAGGGPARPRSRRALVWGAAAAVAFAAAALGDAALSRVRRERDLRHEAEALAQAAGARAREAEDEARAARAEVAQLVSAAAARAAERDFQGALRDLDRALELEPDRADTLAQRGLVRAQQGQRERALEDFERALVLDPRHPVARANRARLERDGAGPVPRQAEAAVLEVGGERAWAACGSGQGVRAGDLLAVYRAGRLVARLQVDEVHEGRCGGPLLLLDSHAQVEPGDIARLVGSVWDWARLERQARVEEALARQEEALLAGGRPLRVLYLDGHAGWEQRYLVQLLTRSRALAARTLLCRVEPELPQGASAGLQPLQAPPAGYDDVDVLVLGDVPPQAISLPAVERLLQAGGGLVLLAGAHGLAPEGLADRSPVLPDPRGPTPGEGFWAPRPGGLQRVLELDPALPPLAEVLGGRVGEDGLALVVDRDARPLAALRRAGGGRVLQVAALDTWRWRRTHEPAWRAFWLEALGRAAGRVE